MCHCGFDDVNICPRWDAGAIKRLEEEKRVISNELTSMQQAHKEVHGQTHVLSCSVLAVMCSPHGGCTAMCMSAEQTSSSSGGILDDSMSPAVREKLLRLGTRERVSVLLSPHSQCDSCAYPHSMQRAIA